jgi:hypothetical protein
MSDLTRDELDKELKALKKANLTTEGIKTRLTLLFDAYRSTFREDVRVTRGVYLETHGDVSPEFCEACFLGTLLLGKLVGVEGDLDFQYNNINLRQIAIELEQVFDTKTLAVGEALFEGSRIAMGPFGDYWRNRDKEDDEERLSKLILEGRWIRTTTEAALRARYLIEHLIENESTFNLEALEHGPTNFDPAGLSKKAVRALRRYGVIT